ncbi:MAG: DUF3592 domain-containing protein [Chloroflexota bacterium]
MSQPKKSSRNHRIFGISIVAVFVLILASITVEDTRDYLDSDTWATTTGTRIRDNNKTAFIEFEYTVNGTRYVGTRTRFYQLVLFTGDTQYSNFETTYPIGSTFPVYYDPADPQRSVINPAFPVRAIMLRVALLTVLIPIWISHRIVSRLFGNILRPFRGTA